MTSRLSVCVAGFWWASLGTVGFLVVPMLFTYLPTSSLAGGMAAKLFTAQTWVSSLCGFFLLLQSRNTRSSAAAASVQAAMVFIVLGMLLALLAEFGVAPHIMARENLRLWHSVGSGMYVLQWVCAATIFWKLTAPRQSAV